MFTNRPANFSKSEDCPSSQELLDFQNGDLTLDRGSEIRLHLPVCEFCSAEVEFYSHYPLSFEEDTAESSVPSAIPEPLYELANALLKNRKAQSSTLESMLWEN